LRIIYSIILLIFTILYSNIFCIVYNVEYFSNINNDRVLLNYNNFFSFFSLLPFNSSVSYKGARGFNLIEYNYRILDNLIAYNPIDLNLIGIKRSNIILDVSDIFSREYINILDRAFIAKDSISYYDFEYHYGDFNTYILGLYLYRNISNNSFFDIRLFGGKTDLGEKGYWFSYRNSDSSYYVYGDKRLNLDFNWGFRLYNWGNIILFYSRYFHSLNTDFLFYRDYSMLYNISISKRNIFGINYNYLNNLDFNITQTNYSPIFGGFVFERKILFKTKYKDIIYTIFEFNYKSLSKDSIQFYYVKRLNTAIKLKNKVFFIKFFPEYDMIDSSLFYSNIGIGIENNDTTFYYKIGFDYYTTNYNPFYKYIITDRLSFVDNPFLKPYLNKKLYIEYKYKKNRTSIIYLLFTFESQNNPIYYSIFLDDSLENFYWIKYKNIDRNLNYIYSNISLIQSLTHGFSVLLSLKTDLYPYIDNSKINFYYPIDDYPYKINISLKKRFYILSNRLIGDIIFNYRYLSDRYILSYLGDGLIYQQNRNIFNLYSTLILRDFNLYYNIKNITNEVVYNNFMDIVNPLTFEWGLNWRLKN